MASYNEDALSALRRELGADVGSGTLRHVAREVGMSPTGLHRFLAGSTPTIPTARRLDRYVTGRGRPLRTHSAMAVLRTLVHDLPPARQPAGIGLLLDRVEAAFAEAAVPRPQWLAELRPRRGA
jgi:hypothetical protein